MEKTCPFCVPAPSRLPVSEGLVLALRDGYPVSRGHSLIVPRRHVGSFGEASLEEQSAMLAMSQRVRAILDAELRPDGYKFGINDGAAAGQTVMHVHMHVIPRYRGDRPDLGGKMREGFAGSFRRRPTIGAAGANDRSARRPGPARFPAARSADF
jgi:diadenosine tetraphosphate (Ap4A) HIT family hydrolase